MRYYTVYERPGGGPADDAYLFIKEGFSWPAMIFAALWLIYERMWLVLAAYLAVALAIGGLVEALGMSEFGGELVLTAYGLLFAFEANDLRRWTLERNGYTLVAIVTGRNMRETEQKFFSEVESGKATTPTSGRLNPESRAPAHSSVLGLFPEPDPS